ncbi:LRR_1 domain-containing protein [Cephalotus follicularis]|uniref:LRR_1 domain-containing protein n=1 Tax=Cephalotus follicularis TaxID=3775 RepID=A0A1Q3D943_CEPFO|nr:LRR_1 domain-containing protein [Cephalotus follicularis]
MSVPRMDTVQQPDKLECPKPKILFLGGEESMTILETFFQGTKELKVLAHHPSLLLPKSLECLTNLRTLRLEFCPIKCNTTSLGKLKRLEVLRIYNSFDVKELPIEVGELNMFFLDNELNTLRILDLSECARLERIPPDVIRRLSLLEQVYFCGSSFKVLSVLLHIT